MKTKLYRTQRFAEQVSFLKTKDVKKINGEIKKILQAPKTGGMLTPQKGGIPVFFQEFTYSSKRWILFYEHPTRDRVIILSLFTEI